MFSTVNRQVDIFCPHMDAGTEFGDWLESEMRRRDWSQADLARMTGLSRQAVSKHLGGKGKKPEVETLMRYADAFGWTLQSLMSRIGFEAAMPEDEVRFERMRAAMAPMIPEEQERAIDVVRAMARGAKKNARKNKRGTGKSI